MEGIKYVNLIEIDPVVIEIRGVENGELAVPVNNTLVHHTAFLAADTRPCVLMSMVLVQARSQKILLGVILKEMWTFFYCSHLANHSPGVVYEHIFYGMYIAHIYDQGYAHVLKSGGYMMTCKPID